MASKAPFKVVKLPEAVPAVAVSVTCAFAPPLNSSSSTTARALRFLNGINLLPRAVKKGGKVFFIT
jgi:hypothetical protein